MRRKRANPRRSPVPSQLPGAIAQKSRGGERRTLDSACRRRAIGRVTTAELVRQLQKRTVRNPCRPAGKLRQAQRRSTNVQPVGHDQKRPVGIRAGPFVAYQVTPRAHPVGGTDEHMIWRRANAHAHQTIETRELCAGASRRFQHEARGKLRFQRRDVAVLERAGNADAPEHLQGGYVAYDASHIRIVRQSRGKAGTTTNRPRFIWGFVLHNFCAGWKTRLEPCQMPQERETRRDKRAAST